MKKLITANDVHNAAAQGQQQICVVLRECIITPEARTVAEQLGIRIDEQTKLDVAPEAATGHTAERQRIREHILAQLPEGSVTETLLAQLIDKVEQQQRSQAKPETVSTASASYRSVTGKGGIKVVEGASVNFGRFNGATDHQVGLSDLINASDGSSMAAGLMCWEKAFFPWTLNYDEIDMVLEGELHIRHQGETLVAKAGDVVFIPKGSSIEFGTPGQVRFLYVAWPANWQEC
ncbi:ethanolamine utilization acetate kinase EutQ [Serratia sp. DD3]|uniref:ethanolamine utilization acetate kinase EutQ n=1 Tax=Serratia sp. DD3 TaxID=1410619 RepID=UPI0003C4F279|nr:ethanolamine utilization acetate kinase EutQ [Serratia sp. DD3]KEY58812.1 ethanolamine utilization protein EutQ [Serratia sp. DD3]